MSQKQLSGTKMVSASWRKAFSPGKVSLHAQEGAGHCLVVGWRSSFPPSHRSMELQLQAPTGEPWVGRSRWRRKEGREWKGEEAEGPLPLKCLTPARCGRGTACSMGWSWRRTKAGDRTRRDPLQKTGQTNGLEWGVPEHAWTRGAGW